MNIKFKYFSCKEGHAVSRFGTAAFIGSIRVIGGFEWNEDAVVAIPETEFIRYQREYNRVIKDGALIERTKSDYDSWNLIQESIVEDTAKPADDSEVKQDKEAPTVKLVGSKKRKTGGKK